MLKTVARRGGLLHALCGLALLLSCCTLQEDRTAGGPPRSGPEGKSGAVIFKGVPEDELKPGVPDQPVARREIPEGYWLGMKPHAHDMRALKADGIKVILSAVDLDREARDAMRALGIEQVRASMGGSFRLERRVPIDYVASRYAPDEIYIHCEHGEDRTGVIAAYLLVTRHGWTIADALYAVLRPTPKQVAALGRLLAANGIEDHRTLADSRVGIYSPGGRAEKRGLKADTPPFEHLIQTTIDAMRDALVRDRFDTPPSGVDEEDGPRGEPGE